MSVPLEDLCYLQARRSTRHGARVHPYWPRVQVLVRATLLRYNLVTAADARHEPSEQQYALRVALCLGDQSIEWPHLALCTEWLVWMWTFQARIDAERDAQRRAALFAALDAVLGAALNTHTRRESVTRAPVWAPPASDDDDDAPDEPVAPVTNIDTAAAAAAQDTVDASGEDAHVALLRRVCQTLEQRRVPHACAQRFLGGARTYLLANLGAAPRQRPATLAAFMHDRVQHSALEPCLALAELHALEYARGGSVRPRVPPAEDAIKARHVAALEQAYIALHTLSADLFAYEQQVDAHGADAYNWLVALQAQDSIGSAEAVALAKRHLAAHWKRFTALEALLCDGAHSVSSVDRDARRIYTRLLRMHVTGDAYWALYIARAHNPPRSDSRLVARL